jgi:lipopolysaccharide/colanic/teichoic acid biosynthesis glycosyltransferase
VIDTVNNRVSSRAGLPKAQRISSGEETPLLTEKSFSRMIALERKRSERSRRPFVLMLLDAGKNNQPQLVEQILSEAFAVLLESTRETDIKGLYQGNSTIGVMFIEFGITDPRAVLSTLLSRVRHTLEGAMSPEHFQKLTISIHLFPEDWTSEAQESPGSRVLYPDLLKRAGARKGLHFMKRVMDVLGAMFALILTAPIFVVIAACIKLTSHGPIFFRQQRIGQYGIPFTFLKFRSMYINNDASVHREFVRKLIAGNVDGSTSSGEGNEVYKITGDARVTAIGRFLRRTSLDELPQLINVLQGEMSLVGPRPAIPYEVEAYEPWHRGRLLEAKPGITGLWQVNGRSRVKFDDMVRLDIRYARTWSLWLDIKILLRTPFAVLIGEGAY